MALSDYDTMVMDLQGGQEVTQFTSGLGLTVRPYKNWLYLNHAKAWSPGGLFVEDTIGSVRGTTDIALFDAYITTCELSNKTGLAFLVYTNHWDKKGRDRYAGIAGVARYGWEPEGPNMSHTDEKCGVGDGWHRHRVDWDTGEWGPVVPEPVWQGVTAEDIEDLHVLWDKTFDSALAWPDTRALVRSNQGDAYLSSHLGMVTPETVVGAAEAPILISALRRTDD